MYKFLVHCLKIHNLRRRPFFRRGHFARIVPFIVILPVSTGRPGLPVLRESSLSTIRGSDQHPQCLSPDGDLTLSGIRHSNDGPFTRLCGSGEINLEEHHVMSRVPELAVLRMSERRTHCGAVLISEPRISESFGDWKSLAYTA